MIADTATALGGSPGAPPWRSSVVLLAGIRSIRIPPLLQRVAARCRSRMHVAPRIPLPEVS